MFVSPVFAREFVTAPRRSRHYVARATYVSALLMLMGTAWLVVAGSQVIRDLGDLARFGTMLFQILAPLQLAVTLFFSALICASSVSQEKDRRTLDLLLVTDLSNVELVVGKVLASMLNVLVLLSAALPLFFGLLLLGGVEVGQVVRMFAVTVFSALAAGSLGSVIALWREKTFQAIAMTVLALVFWVALWEAVARVAGDVSIAGIVGSEWALAFSPWQAILHVTQPAIVDDPTVAFFLRPETLFMPIALGGAVLLNAIAVWKVRDWNPSRAIIRKSNAPRQVGMRSGASAVASMPSKAGQSSRSIWRYPILWREIRTLAYGRKTLAIRLTFLLLGALGWLSVASSGSLDRDAVGLVVVPLFLLSLVLINAQAVTSVSSERDEKTLDLLLVTDLSSKEFVFGKLGGVYYNAKEMVLVPLAFCAYLGWRGIVSTEEAAYLAGGLLVMDLFVAVLGIHCGLIHSNTRIAIGTSLGTVFFLFVGIATCMRIMLAFSGSFGYQLAPFLAFMLGGGIGLYVSLGARNASTAILWAAFSCPFLTFWAITSYLQDQTLGPFLVTTLTYGFATLAMLIPAVSEFDLAAGRTTD